MSRYFLRAEAINLSSVFDDTSQVSVIRGSGLMCLVGPLKVESWLAENRPGSITLSKGASAGVFAFEGKDDADAAGVRDDVEALLQQGALNHMTFAVDVTPATAEGGWKPEREALLAQVRWRQMRSPSFAFPDLENFIGGPCAFDKVRPAARMCDEGPVSASVHARLSYGRQERQKVFSRFAPVAKGLTFTDDLKSLAGRNEGKPSDRKVAVIYIDGNGFSGHQNRLCQSPVQQRMWDEAIQELRNHWLEDFLVAAATDDGFRTADTPKKLRIEILLWGGDDLLLVVPGWRGWRTLASFYDAAASWAVPMGNDGEYLKHAAGVVFCHDSAPLLQVRRLARKLCDEVAKGDTSKEPEGVDGRKQNLVAYEVLESFDHVGPDFDEHSKRRRQGLPAGSLRLDGEKVSSALAAAKVVLETFPRKKLHDAVAAFYGGNEKGALETASWGERELDEPTRTALHRLLDALGGGPGFSPWLHLAETWDYLEG